MKHLLPHKPPLEDLINRYNANPFMANVGAGLSLGVECQVLNLSLEPMCLLQPGTIGGRPCNWL